MMTLKSNKHSALYAITVACNFYAKEHQSRILFLILIIMLLILKNAMYLLQYFALDRIENTTRNLNIMLIQMLFYNFCQNSLVFIAEFIFERHLASYGAKVATIILKNMLYSDNKQILDISGSKIEYYVTEGSKALAKLSRQIILRFFFNIQNIFLDLLYLYTKDKSSKKVVFILGLIQVTVLILVEYYNIKRLQYYLKKTLEISYEREKKYTEAIDNIHIIKSYNHEEKVLTTYNDKIEEWNTMHTIFKYKSYINKMIFDGMGAFFRIMTTIYYVISNSNCDAKDVSLVLRVTKYLLASGAELVVLHNTVLESISQSQVVLDYLAFAREELDKKVRVDIFNSQLEVKDVTYSARGKVIFSGINFTLNKGDKVAMYGRNGVGKSSIFKLLLNFDEFRGQILFDGINMQQLAMQDYHALVTFVPQDTKLFDESIYSNLIVGNDKSFNEVVVECKKIGIHDKIMMLPQGYNTIVGEGGKNINGGLKQKIFYARAFLRDTPIYLFDEPTNNLDEENSKFLVNYINDPLYASKTFLVICHDMEIVNAFPKILKFDESKIILEKE